MNTKKHELGAILLILVLAMTGIVGCNASNNNEMGEGGGKQGEEQLNTLSSNRFLPLMA